MDPKDIDKYLYIRRTPTWLVRGVYIISILTWLCILLGFSGAVIYVPFYRYVAAPFLIFFTVYFILSYSLNLFYRQYNIPEHEALIRDYWQDREEPSVDVFLPICGEDFSLIENTWRNVSELRYSNKKVYVLDDSKENCGEHERVAKEYGFKYLARPDKGYMKKAGNLKYAFGHSANEFIAIFDADFAPHPDFLHDLLPYMTNEKTAIVQSPQYFEASNKVHKRSSLEYGAGQVQEPFYRYIQVSRDRFAGAICCGSNAIYRRKALDSIGGPVMVEHSEDAITGFRLTNAGWRVKYIPIILAIGVCPSDAHSYFHQQHRWSTGSITLALSKDFWESKISWKTKWCYSVGFLFYLYQPISIIFSFQLFWALFFYNSTISFTGGMLFYPATVWGFLILFFFAIAPFRWGSFQALFVQVYAYSHAVITTMLKSSVGWIPTNVKSLGVSLAFRQAVVVLYIYVLAYFSLIALAFRLGMIHLLNYNYYFLQFWIFYNSFFSLMLLWMMYRSMEETHERQMAEGQITAVSLQIWQLKMLGIYTILLTAILLCIVYL